MAWSGTYYELLGIAAGERDPAVIEEAAVRRASCVRAYQLAHEAECTRLLSLIAEALITLLDPVRRAAYDLGLHTRPRRPAPGGKVSRAGSAEETRRCDVRVVVRRRAPLHRLQNETLQRRSAARVRARRAIASTGA